MANARRQDGINAGPWQEFSKALFLIAQRNKIKRRSLGLGKDQRHFEKAGSATPD
jgi:hypothetical protein